MRTALCEAFGIDYPIFAFTPSEHVAAAVSRAGGLGVLGCVRFNDADELERVLSWLDDNTDGKPYGVDIVMPTKVPTEGSSVDLKAMIPPEHVTFVEETLLKLGVPPLPEGEGRDGVLGWLHSVARSHLDVALQHRPVLIANALGSPPQDVIDTCHEHGIQVAALAGAAKHALSHVANGVDIVIAQGYEAGGHTGEVASMVLTPDIVDAVGPDVPVLGAGGIGHEQRHGPHPCLHRQAGAAAQDEVDRGLGRGGCTRAPSDAAAEPPGRRGAPPDQRRRRPGRDLDARRPDRRSDERRPPGRRRGRRSGRRLRDRSRTSRRDQGLIAASGAAVTRRWIKQALRPGRGRR